MKSATIDSRSTMLTVPGVTLFGSRNGAPIVKSFCPFTTSGFVVSPHPSGRGRSDPTTAGSTHRTATPRAGSAVSTRAATLIAGVICTSTGVVAAPMTRWLVAMSPFASTRNPVARVVGVHRAMTLSCHSARRAERSTSGAAAPEETVTTCAFASVSSRTVSRPARTSSVCLHS